MFSPTVDRYTYISRESNSCLTQVHGGRLVESGKGKHSYYSYHTSNWNICGYIPFVRTISGTLRCCLGIADVIYGLAAFVLTKKSEYLGVAKIGIQNVVRGALEGTADVLLLYMLVSCTAIPLASMIALGTIVAPILYDNSKDPKLTVIYER